jgi:hypothetical protein
MIREMISGGMWLSGEIGATERDRDGDAMSASVPLSGKRLLGSERT